MKVALVHDYLFEQGGAENVVERFLEIFPEAPLYTAIYAPETMSDAFRRRAIHTSFLQHLTTEKRRAMALLPLYPAAFHRMKVRGYDVVLSSASSFAKGIDVGDTPHVCYCHTPPRFLWQVERYLGVPRQRWKRAAAQLAMGPLRHLDRADARNVDRFIANSRLTQQRIARVYGREAMVIHPPIAIDEFAIAPYPEPYFLVVSRLLSYKRIDIAIEACNQLALPLLVIGDGPDRARLQALAGPTVTLLGRRPRSEVLAHLARCQALLVAGEEDFGLTPIEANASGRPVLAYRGGGALETVISGHTGWFFDEQQPESLVAVLRRVAGAGIGQLNPEALRAYARRFDIVPFRAALLEVMRQAAGAREKI